MNENHKILMVGRLYEMKVESPILAFFHEEKTKFDYFNANFNILSVLNQIFKTKHMKKIIEFCTKNFMCRLKINHEILLALIHLSLRRRSVI